jgi:hypothetical protein
MGHTICVITGNGRREATKESLYFSDSKERVAKSGQSVPNLDRVVQHRSLT